LTRVRRFDSRHGFQKATANVSDSGQRALPESPPTRRSIRIGARLEKPTGHRILIRLTSGRHAFVIPAGRFLAEVKIKVTAEIRSPGDWRRSCGAEIGFSLGKQTIVSALY